MFISLNRLRERKVFCFVEYNWRLRFEVFLAICLSSLCFGGESFNSTKLGFAAPRLLEMMFFVPSCGEYCALRLGFFLSRTGIS